MTRGWAVHVDDRVRLRSSGQIGTVVGFYIRPSRLVGVGSGARIPSMTWCLVRLDEGGQKYVTVGGLERA